MANTLRFVAPLEPQTETRLKQIQRTTLVLRTRQRAHAIVLRATASTNSSRSSS